MGMTSRRPCRLAATFAAAFLCLALPAVLADLAADAASWAAAQAITPEGQALAAFLDGLNVTALWAKKEHISWFSGEPNNGGATSGVDTHCSSFVAAVCERLGAYVLRPPEHGQVLLASAQTAWVNSSAGASAGWTVLPGAVEAQALANQGHLVAFLYGNPDPKEPGHAVIVRPYAQTSLSELQSKGPRVAQAGSVNSPSMDLKLGSKAPGTYLYAALQCPGPPLLPATAEWEGRDGAGLVSLLLDAAPAGRVDAFKLFYDPASGQPSWLMAAGGLPATANANASAALSTNWYKLWQSSKAKGEPFLTGKRDAVNIAILLDPELDAPSSAELLAPYDVAASGGAYGNGSSVWLSEAGGQAQAFAPAGCTPNRTSAEGIAPGQQQGFAQQGWWYAATEQHSYGLFVTCSWPRDLSAYLLTWSDVDGAPTWRQLSAEWDSSDLAEGGGGADGARGTLSACRMDAGKQHQTCSPEASGVQLTIDPANGLSATLSGLPGGQPPLQLLKATQWLSGWAMS